MTRRVPAAGELAEQRVVGVHDEQRRPGGSATDRTPARGDVLELAVAVELVAEEVAERDHARPHAARDLGQRRLVDLEEAELGVRGGEEGGGDPGEEVRAGAVPGEPAAEDLGDHRRRRRLAVRRGDEHRPAVETRREPVDRTRVDRREELSGQGRAAAAARQARERADRARGGDFEVEQHRLSVPGAPNSPVLGVLAT